MSEAHQILPRLLFIEPNALLATNITNILQDQFQVTVVRSAQAAVIAADKIKPDVVLTELHAVDASVSGFLHEFRSYVEWQHIPVVLYTFSLHIPPSLKQLLAERFNVALILHKSHVTADALRSHLRKLAADNLV